MTAAAPRRRDRWALALALALALPAVAGSQPAPVVSAFEIRVEEGWRPAAGLAELVAVEVGAPLDRQALRHSLRSLRAAVESSEVEAHLRPHADGVDVIFALWTQVRVSEVRLAGEPCFKPARLYELIEQQPGAPLSESRLLRGLYRLKDVHREAGFLEARIRLAVDSDDRGDAVVAYEFECGAPATVYSVVFDGDLGALTPEVLFERLSIGRETRLDEPAVRRDARELEGWLLVEGFRTARVGRPEIRPGPEPLRVRLVYPIEVGPRFEVRVSGADAAQLEREGVLPLQGSERFDEALLLRDLERLRRYFQEAGHYRVKIETRSEAGDQLRRIWVLVEPGPIYELAGVAWEGIRALPASRLETLVGTTARRRFGGKGRLVDELLEQDMTALRSYLATAFVGR